MIAHNHPSGDPKPSSQDVELTKKLAEGLRLMDIALYDHLVIAGGKVYSFKMNGHVF
jgi:DNA repair protein RadC